MGEIGLSLVLLLGAGLLIRSFLSLREVRLGFVPENVLTFRLSLPSLRYPESQDQNAFYKRLEEGIGTLSGVQAVGSTTQVPLSGSGALWTYSSVAEAGPAAHRPTADLRRVSPGYFRAMGTQLLAGRYLEERDNAANPLVVVVDETIARREWPKENPIGKRLNISVPVSFDPLRLERRWIEVVGVVEHARNHKVSERVRGQLYFPSRHIPDDDMTVVVRTRTAPRSFLEAIKGEVRAMDKDLPLYEVRTMEESVAAALAPIRFVAALVNLFAAMALFLASVGVFGVISYSVSQRTHEMGIRMALGAQRRDIIKLVVGQGMGLVLIGVGIGLAASLALTRFLESLLFGVSPTDPLTYTSVSLLLTTVALLACYLPARRATKFDPIVALRYE